MLQPKRTKFRKQFKGLPRSNSSDICSLASGVSDTVTRASGRSSTITLKLLTAPGRDPRGAWIGDDTKAAGPTRTAREANPSSSSSRTRIAQPLITVPSAAVGAGDPGGTATSDSPDEATPHAAVAAIITTAPAR